MYKINFLDLSGRSIFNLTQWDINQQIIIESQTPFSEAPMVHFCNQNSDKAICTTSKLVTEYQIKVNVPNALLIQPYSINVYVYLIGEDAGGQNDSGKAILNGVIPIESRVEPDDFVYEENIHIVYLSKLEEDIIALNKEISDSEALRITNENQRISNELSRISAEAERSSNEEERVSSENIRIENENNRISTESIRQLNESTRQTNESNRDSTEQVRVASENIRISNEETRKKNETARQSSEDTRNTAENVRKASENTRESNEETRIANDSDRQANENIRIENEKLRQSALIECKSATQNANTAAEAANDAAEMALAYISGDSSTEIVTFSESSDYNNISSGESLGTLFGKIQKYLGYIDNDINNQITKQDIDAIFEEKVIEIEEGAEIDPVG